MGHEGGDWVMEGVRGGRAKRHGVGGEVAQSGVQLLRLVLRYTHTRLGVTPTPRLCDLNPCLWHSATPGAVCSCCMHG